MLSIHCSVWAPWPTQHINISTTNGMSLRWDYLLGWPMADKESTQWNLLLLIKSNNFRVCAEFAEEYTSQTLINTLGRQLYSIKTYYKHTTSEMSPLSFDCYILIITTTKIMHLGVNKYNLTMTNKVLVICNNCTWKEWLTVTVPQSQQVNIQVLYTYTISWILFGKPSHLTWLYCFSHTI